MRRLVLFLVLFSMAVVHAKNTKTTCANLTSLAFVGVPGQTNVKTFQFYAAPPYTNRQYTFTFSATGLPSVATLSSSGLLTMTVKSSDIGTTFSGIAVTYTDSTVSTQTVSGLTISVRTNKSYNVATTGHDTDPGTTNLPFLTISKAAAVSLPGDIIYVMPAYYPEKVTVPGGIGSDGSNGAYGGQAAGVNGPDETIFISTSLTNAHCHGFVVFRDYVELNGLSITNFGRCAIEPRSNWGHVVNCYIHDANAARYGIGVGFDDIWYQWPQHWLVESNHFYRCQTGWRAFCFNSTFTRNDVERLFHFNNNPDDSDYSNFFGEGNVFSYNIFHGTVPAEIGDSHVDGFQTYDDPNSGYWVKNAEMHHNYISDADTAFYTEGAFLQMSDTVSFHHNVCYHGLASHPVAGNHPNGVRPFIDRDIPNLTITNNTFSTWSFPGDWRTATTPRATNGYCFNNIFLNYTGGENGSYEFHDFNDVQQSQASAKSVGDYNTAYPGPLSPFPGAHDVVQNPLFVNAANPLGPDGLPFTADDGFILLTNSPALTSSSTGGQVGAYEAVSGGGGPPGSNGPPSIVGAGFRATKVRR